MKLFTITLLATQLSATIAAPAAIKHDSRAVVRPRSPHARFPLVATVTSTIVPSQTSAAAGEGGEGGEGGEEGAEDEVEQAGEFDVPIVLPGGSKVDTLYPPGVSILSISAYYNEARCLICRLDSKTASSRSSSRTPRTVPSL